MGTDKALLEIDGETLINRALTKYKPLFSEIIISSANPEHSVTGCQLVADERENCGPLSGVLSCLKKSGSDWNFVVGVDVPFIEPEFIAFLQNAIGDFDAIVPVHANKVEPLVALYKKSCIPELEKNLSSGNYKMVDVLKTLNVKYLDAISWVEKNPDLFFNLNRREDFKKWR